MSVEQWERRFGCALGMAIYIHVTAGIWHGLFSLFGIGMCMFFAFMPAIRTYFEKRATK